MIGAADSAEQRSGVEQPGAGSPSALASDPEPFGSEQPAGRREIAAVSAATVPSSHSIVSRLMCGAGNGQRVRASQDALIEVARALDQQLWMVRAQRAH